MQDAKPTSSLALTITSLADMPYAWEVKHKLLFEDDRAKSKPRRMIALSAKEKKGVSWC
jgi:hypothetical protein